MIERSIGRLFARKSRPHVILDTESNDVKILTRQVADSLTPPNSTQQSSSIEQDLLDVLRGHRVVSKSARRLEKQSAPSEEKPSEQSRKSSDPLKKPAVQKRARPTSAAAEQTSEAFSCVTSLFACDVQTRLHLDRCCAILNSNQQVHPELPHWAKILFLPKVDHSTIIVGRSVVSTSL